MPRATIRDVALNAGLSISTVNRALHEPEKVRKETIQIVLQSAENVGFYGIGSLREGLKQTRPQVRIGIQLLQSHRMLYKSLNQALVAAAKAVTDHDVLIRIEHVDELTPQNVSEGLLRLAKSSDILGVVSTEHPTVAQTIEKLASEGFKTFALISQITARSNVGYIGMDMWKAGRTVGWAMDHFIRQPGKIGIFVGNHRYRCQETNESGFRSYFREHPRGFELLDARSTFETASIAREITEELLEQHPDIAGIHVSGGGISGVCAALRDLSRAKDIFITGHDLTEVTRAALLDGTINFLLSHPMQQMAEETIAAMIRAVDGGPDFPPQSIVLPFEIYTPENL